jgi:O-antigen ligase
MWRDHAWWGVGPGQFDYRFPRYRPLEVQARPEWTHNDYLNALVDYGAVGTLLVLAAWVLLIWGVVKSWRFARGSRDDFTRKKSNKLAFLVGGLLGLAAILLHSAVDFNFHIPSNAILAVTLMALISSQLRFATERYWFRAEGALRVLLTMVLVAGIAFLGWQESRAAREFVWLHQADRTQLLAHAYNEKLDAARVSALEKALAAEPMNPESRHPHVFGGVLPGQELGGGEELRIPGQTGHELV